MTKVQTIKLKDGNDYARVNARLIAMHQQNKQCSIRTSFEATNNYLVFTAEVETEKGLFTGHSFTQSVGDIKKFEKQETVAVGRALANAGYLIDGAIASADEMIDFEDETKEAVAGVIAEIKKKRSLKTLTAYWLQLQEKYRREPEVAAVYNEKKAMYENS